MPKLWCLLASGVQKQKYELYFEITDIESHNGINRFVKSKHCRVLEQRLISCLCQKSKYLFGEPVFLEPRDSFKYKLDSESHTLCRNIRQSQESAVWKLLVRFWLGSNCWIGKAEQVFCVLWLRYTIEISASSVLPSSPGVILKIIEPSGDFGPTVRCRIKFSSRFLKSGLPC
mgnify:CR=1 FL=1